MRWFEQYDLFLFDLDGLLVDTEKLHFEAYQTLCSRYNTSLDWDYRRYVEIAHKSSEGLRNELLSLLSTSPDWDLLYKEKREIYLDLLKKGSLQLMPGVEKILTELSDARIKRCVVTHSPKEQVERIKTVLPILQSIPVWITREDYENPKPAPDGYLKAIELLADPGDKMIGFEDSLRGFQALSASGAFPVLICDPTHPQMADETLRGAKHFSSLATITNKKL